MNSKSSLTRCQDTNKKRTSLKSQTHGSVIHSSWTESSEMWTTHPLQSCHNTPFEYKKTYKINLSKGDKAFGMHWYCKHMISSVTIQCRQECEAFKDSCHARETMNFGRQVRRLKPGSCFAQRNESLWKPACPQVKREATWRTQHSCRNRTGNAVEWGNRKTTTYEQVSESSTRRWTTPGLNITQIKPQSNLGISVLRNNSPREIWVHKTIRECVCSALKKLEIKR